MKTAIELAMQAIISAGFNETSDGDVESPTGHFAVIERPEDPKELAGILESINDPEEQEAFSAHEVGFYEVIENSQGFVYINGPVDRATAMVWFNANQYAYTLWAEKEHHGL